MSYAVREDGQGWRSVSSNEDCLPGEFLAEHQPVPVEPLTTETLNPLEKLRNFLAENPDVSALI